MNIFSRESLLWGRGAIRGIPEFSLLQKKEKPAVVFFLCRVLPSHSFLFPLSFALFYREKRRKNISRKKRIIFEPKKGVIF